MLNAKNKKLLAVVFGVLAITSLLLFNVYQNVTDTYRSVKTVIEDQQLKRSLLTKMYGAGQERSIILLKMYAESDPFLLDDLNQDMGKQARVFIAARMQLEQLPQSKSEQILLSNLKKLIHQNAPIQDQVAELIVAENRAKVDQLLFKQAIPKQNQILNRIDNIIGKYNAKSNTLILTIQDNIEESSQYFLILGATLIAASIIVVIVISQRLSRQEEQELQTMLVTQKSISSQLTASKNKLTHYIDALSTFTALLTPDGKVEKINQAAIASSGSTSSDFINCYFKDCYWWNYDTVVQNTLSEDINRCAAGEIIDKEATIQTQGGQLNTIRFILTPMKNEAGTIESLIVEGQDITAQKLAAEKLSYQASHDALTNLINRREFEYRLQFLLSRADDHKTHIVFYIDLDQFKVVNDTCGHQAGDELLRQISQVIKHCIRESDVVARLGGDEFGIILEYCDMAKARQVAETIIHKVNDYQFCWQTKTFRIGASIGIVQVSDNVQTLDDILKQIDTACYAAKDAGRSRYHIYMPDDQDLQQRETEMDWISRIELALQENRLTLFAQPIVPINGAKNSLRNYELLVRLQAEDGSTIPPGAFLPAAERYNKMIAIDRWVVQNAISILSENPVFLSQIGHCSINLSCQSLTDKGFLTFIVSQLNKHPNLARQICLEITETAAITNLAQATACISFLRNMGIRFALDDFGSGLSSFGYLKNLQIDYLKIDGMFVKDITTDPIDRAMVKSIHEVGSVMGKQTIAEFVENDDILRELTKIGIDYAQGYGVGKPIPLQHVIQQTTEELAVSG